MNGSGSFSHTIEGTIDLTGENSGDGSEKQFGCRDDYDDEDDGYSTFPPSPVPFSGRLLPPPPPIVPLISSNDANFQNFFKLMLHYCFFGIDLEPNSEPGGYSQSRSCVFEKLRYFLSKCNTCRYSAAKFLDTVVGVPSEIIDWVFQHRGQPCVPLLKDCDWYNMCYKLSRFMSSRKYGFMVSS